MIQFIQRNSRAVIGILVVGCVALLGWGIDFYASNIMPAPVIAVPRSSGVKSIRQVSPAPIKTPTPPRPLPPLVPPPERFEAASLTFGTEKLAKLFKYFDDVAREKNNQHWEYYYYTMHNIKFVGTNEMFGESFLGYHEQPPSFSPSVDQINKDHPYSIRLVSVPGIKLKIDRLYYSNHAKLSKPSIDAHFTFSTEGPFETDRFHVAFRDQGILLFSVPNLRVNGVYCDKFEHRYHASVDQPIVTAYDYSFFESPEQLKTYLLSWQELLENEIYKAYESRRLIQTPIYEVRCAGGAGIEPAEKPLSSVTEETHRIVYRQALAYVKTNRQLINDSYEKMLAALIEAFPDWRVIVEPRE